MHEEQLINLKLENMVNTGKGLYTFEEICNTTVSTSGICLQYIWEMAAVLACTGKSVLPDQTHDIPFPETCF